MDSIPQYIHNHHNLRVSRCSPYLNHCAGIRIAHDK